MAVGVWSSSEGKSLMWCYWAQQVDPGSECKEYNLVIVAEICKVLPNYSNLNGLFSMNSMFLDKINVLELNCKFLLAVRAMLVEN